MIDADLELALAALPREGTRIQRPASMDLVLQIRLEAYVEKLGGRVVPSVMRFEPELVLTPAYYELPAETAG